MKCVNKKDKKTEPEVADKQLAKQIEQTLPN